MLRRSAYALLVLGLLSVGLYTFAFASRYPIVPIAERGGVPDIGILSGYRWAACAEYVAAIVGAFVLYGLALYVAGRAGGGRALVWSVAACGALAATALIATYPFAASDVFLYAARARVLGVYGRNPFTVPPNAFPIPTYVPFPSEWASVVSPYGPLWEWLAAPLARLGDGSLLRTLLAFKGLALATYLGCIALVAAIARRRNPEGVVRAVVAFAWNPLVLIEAHANGHNDLAMVLCVLLALWLWETERYVWVIPALTLGGLIKYVPFMLVPLVAAMLGNRMARGAWLRTLLAAGLISVGLVLIVFGPLWPGLERWSLLTQMRRAHFSTGMWLLLLLRKASLDPKAFYVAEWTTRLLFAAGYGVVLAWAVARPASLAVVLHDALYLWLAVGSMAFGYWYIAWLVPLAALIPGRSDLRRAATFSLTGLLSVAVYTYLGTKWRDSVGFDVITLVTVPVVFALPFIIAGWPRREESDGDRRQHRDHATGWFGPYVAPLAHPAMRQVNEPVAGVPVYPFEYDLAGTPGAEPDADRARPVSNVQRKQDGQVPGDR